MNDSVVKFLKKHERSLQEEATHKAAVDLLRGAISRNAAEMNFAAAAGDVESYRKIKAEKAAKEEELTVLEASFRAPVPDLDEAVSAWEGYCVGYKNAFKKKYAALQAARNALKDALNDLAECQNAALKVRERLAKVCGIQFTDMSGSLDVFPVEGLNEQYVQHPRFVLNLPDMDLLVELGIYQQDLTGYPAGWPDAERLDRVFRLGRSAD